MKWLQIKNSATDANSIDEIYIYGEIGSYWDELDAKTLAYRLKNSTGDELNIRINSGGGEVFTATSFYSLLKASGKKINVFIDGLAASAATIIASAGDVVTMPANALYMIHNPLTLAYGNAEEMREMADVLDKVRDALVATYVEKTGMEEAKVIELMDAETWMTAKEAQEFGFIDEILSVAVAASTSDVITMSSERLKNIPQDLLNAVKSANDKPKEVINPMDLAKFKAEYSDVAKAHAEEVRANIQTEIKNAVEAERQRIQDINDAALAGQEDLAKEAITNGLSVGEFAIKALKSTKDKGQTAIDNANKDRQIINNVPATPVENDDDKPETKEDKIANALEASLIKG